MDYEAVLVKVAQELSMVRQKILSQVWGIRRVSAWTNPIGQATLAVSVVPGDVRGSGLGVCVRPPAGVV